MANELIELMVANIVTELNQSYFVFNKIIKTPPQFDTIIMHIIIFERTVQQYNYIQITLIVHVVMLFSAASS